MNSAVRILIVDDSPEDCAAYRRYLLRGGDNLFEVVAMHSLKEGLACCRASAPDCILLDFSLPDGDGLDFLAQIRAEYGENGPAVIMLTGQGNEVIAVQAMKLGAQDYLVKNSAADNLRRAIQAAMQCMSLRREIEAKQLEVTRLSESQALLVQQLEERANELSDADRRKNEFLAVLAHELRNPLGPIRNAAHIMNRPDLPLADVDTARKIIERQIGHMSRLIDDLLDVSRIVRGKVRLRTAHLELGSLVRTAAEDHRKELEDAGLMLILDLPVSEIWIDADPTRLSQVLGNLLDNSRKFTPSGGTVLVALRVERSPSVAMLRVVDSGEGLDTATLEHMFDVFSQADRSLDHSRGGLGLGLAIVKGIVELHDGNVSAHSDGLGKGCEISISVPVTAADATRTPGPLLATPTIRNHLRILVVEDNLDAAQCMRILLETLGHKVAVAHTGQTALETAYSFRPELVLCDIGLADGMSGYTVAERFRQDPILASAYLVAVTGYGRDEDQKRASDAGFDLHLTKPVALDTLQSLPSRVSKA